MRRVLSFAALAMIALASTASALSPSVKESVASSASSRSISSGAANGFSMKSIAPALMVRTATAVAA